MKKFTNIIASMLVMVGIVAAPLTPSVVSAALTPAQAELCRGTGGTPSGDTCNNNANTGGVTLEQFIKNIINILLFVIGAVAVIMIIIGGIRYTTSNGDQSSVTGAKNTILYAIVGLVVAILAYAIVNFVITNVN